MSTTNGAMQAGAELLARQPLVALHLTAALLSLAVGTLLMLRRKGTFSHRTLGWTFVAAMGVTALTSAFIFDRHLPNIAGLTPIHLLTLVTAVALPLGVRHARRGDVASHRRLMTRLFFGACVTAGLFTLVPGRFLGNLLWQDRQASAATTDPRTAGPTAVAGLSTLPAPKGTAP